MKIKNKLILHLISTIIFVYIFVQFLTLKSSNRIYKFYNDYIMNRYCIILYILIIMFISKYDNYISILLFILIMIPFKCAYKEYFEDEKPSTTVAIITDSLYLDTSDDRFKMDDVAKDNILKQIKAQVDFDPYKSSLAKNVIYEIYNKYFDNDTFKKLNSIDQDSKDYIASGNFQYVPKLDKVNYDISTYQSINYNSKLGGANPITDNLSNTIRRS